MKTEEGFLVTEIVLSLNDKIRKEFPLFRHRRKDIYKINSYKREEQ
ncbi:MAG: hypothetical protein ACOCQ2_02125 [Halanaerobiales bacterium]